MEPFTPLHQALTFGFIAAGLVAAWFLGAALGGFRFGSFLRQIEIVLPRTEIAAFTQRFNQRLAELSFNPTGASGEFLQGGAVELQDAAAFTHSKSPKILRVTMEDSGLPEVKFKIALHYLNWIVADTGEGSYRDAVLQYVTGQSATMEVVPNRSFMAVCTCVGGIFTWLALFAFRLMGPGACLPSVLVMGLTYSLLGVLAIVAIMRKAGKATGIPWAITGLLASCSATIAAVILKD